MKLVKVLALAVLTISLGSAVATGAICHENVCNDHLMFCLAGCPSGPNSCRQGCYGDYDSCTQCPLLEENLTLPPSGHGGHGHRGMSPVGGRPIR